MYKVAKRKIRSISIYNKNQYLGIQWIAFFADDLKIRNHCLMLGDKQAISNIYELSPCDLCLNQISCSMNDTNNGNIVMHSDVMQHTLKKLNTEELKRTNQNDIAYIECIGFQPSQQAWKETLDKYGFHLF